MLWGLGISDKTTSNSLLNLLSISKTCYLPVSSNFKATGSDHQSVRIILHLAMPIIINPITDIINQVMNGVGISNTDFNF